MIKNFSFLLFPRTWFEPTVLSGSLAVLKSCGEAARNFLGKNAFGLIQEYCTAYFAKAKYAVPREGLEPSRACAHNILSVTWLPISPPRLNFH